MIYKRKFICLFVCLLCALPHLCVDPDETIQSDPGDPSDVHGRSDVEPSERGPGGQGHNFEKAVAEVALVELLGFLCHRKDYTYAYTFVTGCM